MLHELLIIFAISYILILGVFLLEDILIKQGNRFSEIAVGAFVTTVIIFTLSVIATILK